MPHCLKNNLFGFLSFMFCILLLASCGSPASENISFLNDSSSILRGESIFTKQCSGCHNFKQDGIGPDLSGITETDSVNWIRQFIRGPEEMIESGDDHAKKLQAIYHTVMPSFSSFKEDEMNQLLAFLHTQKIKKKEPEDPTAIKDPIPQKIAASDLQVDLEEIMQLPSTSDKAPATRISKMEMISPGHHWFILDQRGKLYKISNQKPVIFLDMKKWKPNFIAEPGLATGFGSFAFHPHFSENGLFYTSHCEMPHSKKADFSIPDSIKQTLQWVVSEWKARNPMSDTFSGTSRELFRIDMVTGLHGVQEITFNPRAKPGSEDFGLLYIGVGDGGSVENGFSFLTSHPDKIWGTILCIDPMGRNSRNGQYGIPKQNPFSNKPVNESVQEIYADGFRDPNRISWLSNGKMVATNIGQANIEALNIILKEHHYGWPQREGWFEIHPFGNINHVFTLPINDAESGITYPVAAFDHDEGKAIAGGFEYTGNQIPKLKGKYLFGDIPTGRLFYVSTKDLKTGGRATIKEWFVAIHGKRKTLKDLCGDSRVDLRFARDDQGEMYMTTKPDGKIYQFK